ncbi:MAG: hypothetical protein AAF333_01555 [Planctomycetota bacterium]
MPEILRRNRIDGRKFNIDCHIRIGAIGEIFDESSDTVVQIANRQNVYESLKHIYDMYGGGPYCFHDRARITGTLRTEKHGLRVECHFITLIRDDEPPVKVRVSANG